MKQTMPTCLLALLLLLFTASAHASRPLSVRQQLRAKDATIADLKQQIAYLAGEVAHLRAMTGYQSGDNSNTDNLSSNVYTYNRLMHRAQDDLQKSDKTSKSFESVMSDANIAVGTPDFQSDAATARSLTADMKKYNDDADSQIKQAAALRRLIMASPQFSSRYTEGDTCLNAGDLGDEWRAIHADEFRFFTPAH